MSATVRCGLQGRSWVSVRNNLASSSLLPTVQIHTGTHHTHKCSHSHINEDEEGGREGDQQIQEILFIRPRSESLPAAKG